MKRIGIGILFVLFLGCVAHGQRYHRLPDLFQMERKIRRPITIPASTFNQIWTSVHNRYFDETQQRFKRRLAGTNIDLDGDPHLDFIVQGDDGANITGFWIFRNAGKSQRMVLDTRGLGLQLLKGKHRGLRDILVFAATATTGHTGVYRFNGRRYVATRCWWEDLGVDHAKRHYVPCR